MERRNPHREKIKRRISHGVLIAMLVILSVVLAFPLIILILTSFKTYDELILNPTGLFPRAWSTEAFVQVFSENPYFLYLGNTLLITVVSVLGCCLTSAFVAYGFSRFRVRGSGLIFAVLLSGMLIPGQVLTIPMFELYDKIGWTNSFLPFLIPPLFGGGIVNIFLQRQFMRGINRSVFEAAEIDGASELRIFLNITLPMSIPVMITIAIFTFLNSWNDLFGPLIYLEDPRLWTLAKGNYMIYQAEMGKMGSMGTDVLPWNILSAASLVTVVPIIVLYAVAQRYFMEGIQITGSKE